MQDIHAFIDRVDKMMCLLLEQVSVVARPEGTPNVSTNVVMPKWRHPQVFEEYGQ
jgi:hypothetical protein